MSVAIRRFRESDWPAVWGMLRATNAAGDVFAFAPDSTEADMHKVWIDAPAAVFVACDADDRVVGSYFLKPNQQALGSHVSNAGYLVAPEARGQGIASQMCGHSLAEAATLGFRAMQFNFVVSTNQTAIHVWQKHGFTVVGRLPGAFRHASLGYVDALVMFKTLAA